MPLRHLVMIAACSAIFMLPAVLLGSGGADLHCQSLWVKLFSEQFWKGEWYPRWLADMFAGNGSPVFFYYPPLTYFITALFAFLASFDPFGYTPIAVSAWVAVIVSGVTFYWWLRDETGDGDAALMGSLLYMAAPNHIAQNFYYALLFSSVWAYAWVPLLLMFARNVALGRRYAVMGMAVSLFLLIMTNPGYTLIFGPVAVAYGLIYFNKSDWVKQLVRLSVAVALGFGLSGVYLLPSVVYLPFANVELHWVDIGKANDYSRSNLFVGFDNWSSKIYTLYLIAAAVLTYLYYRTLPSKPSRNFFLLVSVAAFFMMVPLSKPVWDHVQLVKMLQMAERFFVIPSLALAFFGALAFPRWRMSAYGLLLVYAVITMAVAANTRMSMTEYSKENPQAYTQYRLNIDQYPEYLTTPDLITRYFSQSGVEEVLQHHNDVDVISGAAKVTVRQWQPRHIALHYVAERFSTLQVGQFDFPGWRAFSGERELEVARDKTTGQMQVDVSAGEGDIRFELTPLYYEVLAKLISVVSAIMLSLLFLLEFRRYKFEG